MRAILLKDPGPSGRCEIAEVPIPDPGEGEILIRVHASGVNRADMFQKENRYPLPKSGTPGLEVAGVVEKLGKGVSHWKIGERVCALLKEGGYAEYAVAKAAECLPLSASMSYEDGAAVIEALGTCWHGLVDLGELKAGETVLIHGGTSGIGVIAIQMAKALGATAFTTSGTDKKRDLCLKLGAKRAINYKNEDFVAVIEAETGGKGANLILDMVGGDYIPKNFKAAALDGRIIQIAFLNGPKTDGSLGPILTKRLSWKGMTLNHQPEALKAGVIRAIREKLWEKLEKGEIFPVIARVFALEEAQEALSAMQQGQHAGKIVLRTNPSKK